MPILALHMVVFLPVLSHPRTTSDSDRANKLKVEISRTKQPIQG